MIRRVTISNYRSLGPNVTLDLDRLTALVGPNDVGKSNVLDALQFLGDATRLGLEIAFSRRAGFGSVRRWSAGRPYDVVFAADVEARDVRGTYEFAVASTATGFKVKYERARVGSAEGRREQLFEIADGKWQGGARAGRVSVDASRLWLPFLPPDPAVVHLLAHLRQVRTFSFVPNVLRGIGSVEDQPVMQRDGHGWPTALRAVLENGRADDFRAALYRLTGDVIAAEVRDTEGLLIPVFRHGAADDDQKRAPWFRADQESDGTLRFAAILTVLLQRQHRGSLVAFEEPELNLHVGALRLLYDFLDEASDERQVVFTTQSPDLLDRLGVDSVRIVERRDGVTSIGPLAPDQQRVVRDRLMTLGDVARMEGLHMARPRRAPRARRRTTPPKSEAHAQ